ncbi:hypothetical protein M0R45_008357 [Rubus argutus]|uniref:HMA domain-containing protein n=1 Tax=Rubus argutus TaxID=59490 RepID=A0AAW1Y0K0_RUBAR
MEGKVGGSDGCLSHGGCKGSFLVSGSTESGGSPDVRIILAIPLAWIVPLVTTMVLKVVDLQCEKCYKKVKKVLCKFPQIRDQTYDEKNNQVTIKVVCCSPEKFRDKLCCKGRCVIKSIEIIKPPPPPKPTPAPEPPKPTPAPDPPKPTPAPDPPKPTCTCRPVICRCRPVICRCPPVICTCPPVICTCLPAPPPVKCPRPPVNTCCRECSGGHPGWPCQTGHGCGVLCPYIQYVCYCGRPGFDCYCVTRPNCFIEENSPACAIM